DTEMSAGVLVIALDAADPGLVQTLAARGDMPTLARLLDDSAQMRTLAPEGVFVSANWPTIFTGLRPDRHHYLCWEEIPGDTYDHLQTTPHEVQGTPFWDFLSEQGRRVCVFDVRHCIAP